MILVLASAANIEAARFVQEWHEPGVSLLTPDDLSTAHWFHALQGAGANRFGLSGKPYDTDAVRAVLVLLPGIREVDLGQIVPEDRAYVAAEMNAFLFFWLNDLRCPVINRPQAGSLMGPAWGLERWRWEAHAVGLPLGARVPSLEGLKSISVVGEQIFGTDDEHMQRAARRLARSANTSLLTLVLVNNEFLYAHARPQLNDKLVARAVRELILRSVP
jgi:hypothetical protein